MGLQEQNSSGSCGERRVSKDDQCKLSHPHGSHALGWLLTNSGFTSIGASTFKNSGSVDQAAGSTMTIKLAKTTFSRAPVGTTGPRGRHRWTDDRVLPGRWGDARRRQPGWAGQRWRRQGEEGLVGSGACRMAVQGTVSVVCPNVNTYDRLSMLPPGREANRRQQGGQSKVATQDDVVTLVKTTNELQEMLNAWDPEYGRDLKGRRSTEKELRLGVWENAGPKGFTDSIRWVTPNQDQDQDQIKIKLGVKTLRTSCDVHVVASDRHKLEKLQKSDEPPALKVGFQDSNQFELITKARCHRFELR
ncbi:hypothetical protein GWK47_017268 [Chionoecetes opilio]|uniref:Uncharacterized protein n=1 Tax=Chionoecetes opilio TaxID=41210 RepID=A0A8J5CM52_CHIOP|nr:hypothetical protein GWK47_017268 [Chionoecetes opilio]